MEIKVGDTIRANEQTFLVTDEPYIPDGLDGDSAIDETYCKGEYIIPVDSGSAIYESEVADVISSSYTLYGIDVAYYKKEDVHRAFIGFKKYETKSKEDMMYIIQNLQAGVGVVH